MDLISITIYAGDNDIATFLHNSENRKIILSRLLKKQYIVLYDVSREEAKNHFPYGIRIGLTPHMYGISEFVSIDNLINNISCRINALKNKEDYIHDDKFIEYCINNCCIDNIYSIDGGYKSVINIYKEFDKFIYLSRECKDDDHIESLCKDSIRIPSLDDIMDTGFRNYDVYNNTFETDKFYRNITDPIDPNDFVYMCKNYYNDVLVYMEQWLSNKQSKIDIIKSIMNETDTDKIIDFISTYVKRKDDE